MCESFKFWWNLLNSFISSYVVIFKKSVTNPISSMFSSKSFIVLVLVFKSLIHFELIFAHGVRQGSKFILLLVNMQFSQCHLSRKLSFYTLNGLDTLVENHLTIYRRIYFWALYTLYYSIGPCICLYASTTLFLLL